MREASAWRDALAASAIRAAGGVSDARLREVDRLLGRALPADLRTLLVAADGLFDTRGQWWVIWPSDRVVEDSLYAWRVLGLDPELIAFGDDGTGNPFCINSDNVVVHWSYIDTAVEREVGRIPDLLAEWVNATLWPPPAGRDR